MSFLLWPIGYLCVLFNFLTFLSFAIYFYYWFLISFHVGREPTVYYFKLLNLLRSFYSLAVGTMVAVYCCCCYSFVCFVIFCLLMLWGLRVLLTWKDSLSQVSQFLEIVNNLFVYSYAFEYTFQTIQSPYPISFYHPRPAIR